MALAVSAEKGYSREAGNLVFHVCLLLALVLFAVGKLYSYQGSIVTVEGTGFCNRPISYDAFHSGRLVNNGALANFCVDNLDSFTASYRPDGTAQQFRAAVTYSTGLDGAPRHDVITVNHPLRTEGDRVYLINHGFAPTVTVTRPGKAPITDTEAFLPEDELETSEGAFSFPGADSAAGQRPRPERGVRADPADRSTASSARSRRSRSTRCWRCWPTPARSTRPANPSRSTA